MTRRILSVLSVAVSFGCSIETTQEPSTTGGSAGAGATSGTAGSGGSSGTVSGSTGGTSGGSGGAGALGGGGAGVGGASTGGSGAMSGGGGTSGSGQSEGGKGGGLGGAGAGGSGGSGGAITSGAGGSGGAGGASRSEGCGKAAPASQRYGIDVGGTMREYIIAVPENYDPERAYPLVFAWHPLGGSAQQVAGMGSSGYYGLRAQADGGAIFVSPEGLEFNGGNKGWANSNGRDIAFLEAMLTRFRGELCIDESRIFSTGFSFGGMMSFAVGCAMGGVFRAIAPMAGNTQVSGCMRGDQPVAIMGFHGLDDTVVDIDGGRRGRDEFIDRNGCTEQTMPVEPSWCSGISDNYQPCSCVSYQGCTAGYPVIWCEFTGPHTPAPNSAATIWSFFSQF